MTKIKASVLCLLSCVLLAPFAQAGEIITQPWLQNVYTNRVTVMCETLGEMPGLSVVVQGVKEEGRDSFEMVPTNGLKEGTFVYQAQISLKPGKHPTYELVTNGVAIAGTEGSVMAWQDGDAAFTCAIWGDNQEGVQKYDWGNDVASERYRCITNMFVHMASQKPDFGFSTGDFSSDALYDEEILPGELRGADDLFGRTIPYHLVWGNHDCIGTFLGEVYTNAAQRYFAPAVSEEEGVFALYRNDVLFIGVHWTWGKDDAEVRYDEITNKVARILATDRAKNAKFRILFQHAPIFLEVYNVLPKVDWFSDTRLLDIAKQGGVDLVFSGHTHAYERIEHDGMVQIVNGGMGYLDHGERWYNNYGSDTKVGGHQNTPLLWARQSSSSLITSHSSLAPAQPVRMGCFQGYGILSVTNNTLTYKAHAFNADGSYIGVADAFSIESKTVDAASSPRQNKDVTSFDVRGEDAASTLTAPVNNATWKAYKDAQGETWTKPAGAADTDPVVNVSKTEIERFCAALNAGKSTNYRLPTVAELTAAFGGNLKRDVSEWTADVDPDSGWCRILGGNKVAVDYTWCREYDKPAMAAPDCHANYLGFRVVDAPVPSVVPSAMDQALAALGKKVAAGEPIAEVYEWKKPSFIEPYALVDITDDWTNGTLTTKYEYENPVIFTGSGDLRYRVRKEVVFGGGLAVPNATSLDLSHVLDLGIVSKPITVKGDFRGGVTTDEWRFYLKCDELTLDNVKYRGQVFNAITDSRALNLVGTNDFSGAVMSICIDGLLVDPQEDFVNNLVADKAATLKLRRLDFSTRGVAEEVLRTIMQTASFTVGEDVTLITAEDVLFGIKGATLTVDGALDAAGIDIAGHLLGLLPQEATVTGAGALTTTHFGMCDKSTLNVGVLNVKLLSSVPYRTYTDPADGCNVKYVQRTPAYTLSSGRDWLFNHDIAAKRCALEPSQDPGVDLFFIYPTAAKTNDVRTVDGYADIDDPQMRGDAATQKGGAYDEFENTGSVFADFTRVYAPFYRQATMEKASEIVQDNPDCPNEAYAETLYGSVAYADITNALTHYFTTINPNGERPFILAGHSQGSALLRNLMERYFQDNQQWLGNMVACYAIGYGVSEVWAESVKAYAPIATNATDAGVYVTWNTEGPANGGPSILQPTNDCISVNPISWTRTTGPSVADKSQNLGGWTNRDVKVVWPHLYGATNNVARGTIVCPEATDYEEKAEGLYGDQSLHEQDYKLYWENLRDNAYARIKTETGSKPCCGTPTDYADAGNWMKKPAAEKTVDVFYLYPTCVPGTCTTLVGEIEDGMKAAANEHYKKGPSTFESYANVYAPYYRQGSGLALASDLSPDGIQRFCSTHVVKTDVFAALDYFFTNINVNAKRPFILASHSQGSANMKNVFEEYFVGEKASYTNTLVAAYVLGYKITPDWCEKVGVPFATCADDVRVVMTWNAEGPGEQGDNFLTADPTQLAINPLNWKRDTTEALKATNLGSVITNAEGILYNTGKPGVTGTRLQTNRPGAVIVDAPETIPVGISPGFGTRSYHFEDWGFFHDNIGANGFTRYAAFAGLKEVVTNNIPTVADATWKVLADGAEASVNPVDGKYYAPAKATTVELVYTLDAAKAAEGLVFTNGETAISFPMEKVGGVWVSTMTEDEIKAATKVGKATGLMINGTDIVVGSGAGWSYDATKRTLTLDAGLGGGTNKVMLAGGAPAGVKIVVCGTKFDEIVLSNFTNDVSGTDDAVALKLDANALVTLVGTNYLASGAGKSAIVVADSKYVTFTTSAKGALAAASPSSKEILPGIDGDIPYVSVDAGTYSSTIDPKFVTHEGVAAFSNGDGTWTVKEYVEIKFYPYGLYKFAPSITVRSAKNECVAKPEDPVKVGANPPEAFVYWKDLATQEEFDFDSQVTGDKTLEAIYTIDVAAGVEAKDGTIVPATDVTNAVEKVIEGGTVVATNAAVQIEEVDKPIVIVGDKDKGVDVKAAEDSGLTVAVSTNEVDGTVVAVVGTNVADVVVVEKPLTQPEVSDAQKPAEADPEAWETVTNAVATVQSPDVKEIVGGEALEVAAAVAKKEGADAVVTEVKLLVEPVAVSTNTAKQVADFTVDIQPVLTVYGIKDGAMTNVLAASTNDFALSGRPVTVTLDVSAFDRPPMLIKHVHGTETEYIFHPAIALEGEKTFVYDAVKKTLSFEMSEFSDVTVSFEEREQPVTASVWPTAAGVVTGTGSYRPDEFVTLTATANENWQFAAWSGLPAGATVVGNKATFTMPETAVDVTARFEVSAAYRKACEDQVATNRAEAVAALDELDLDDDEYEAYLKKIDDAAKKAKAAIGAAVAPAGAAAAVVDASATNLATYKDAAKTSLANVVEEAKAELAELALTDEELADAYEAIDEAVEKAVKELDAAKTLDAAKVAYTTAEETVVKIVEAGGVIAQFRIQFATTSLEATEGETAELVVNAGSEEQSVQATLNFIKGTLTKVTAQMEVNGKLKKVRFPLTLNWEKGDTEAKVIYLTTTASKRVEADKFATFQLSAPAGAVLGKQQICTFTVHDAVDPEPDETPYVRALAWPANDGTVSGSGTLPKENSKRTLTAKAKKWATFAGWYRACTNDANKIDLEYGPVCETKKLTVYQEDAGTYFAYFTDGTPVITVKDPDFTAEGTVGVTVDEEGTATCQVGWYVEFALDYVAEEGSKPKLSVSKLPAGLKYDKKTGLVYGIPTKAGAFTVTVKGTNVSGKHTITFDLDVEALPDEMVGTFEGVLTDAATNLVGTATVKVTRQGKVTTKVTYGKTYSFSGTGFGTAEDCDMLLEKKNTGTVALTVGRDADGEPDGTYTGVVEGEKFGNQQLFFEVEK